MHLKAFTAQHFKYQSSSLQLTRFILADLKDLVDSRFYRWRLLEKVPKFQ
jgi:hypothetical protein